MAIASTDFAPERFWISRADIQLATAIVCVTAAGCLLVLAADQWWDIDYYDLVRDPNAIAGNPNYFGVVSNLGIVLWIAGAVGALQAYAALGRRRETPLGATLFFGGVFAALMGLDDLFMLHESVATIGIPEIVVLLPHALVLATLCYKAWMVREATPWILLGAGVAAFGVSLVVDVYPKEFGGQVFIEESFKLLGILFLTAYLVMVGQQALRAR